MTSSMNTCPVCEDSFDRPAGPNDCSNFLAHCNPGLPVNGYRKLVIAVKKALSDDRPYEPGYTLHINEYAPLLRELRAALRDLGEI